MWTASSWALRWLKTSEYLRNLRLVSLGRFDICCRWILPKSHLQAVTSSNMFQLFINNWLCVQFDDVIINIWIVSRHFLKISQRLGQIRVRMKHLGEFPKPEALKKKFWKCILFWWRHNLPDSQKNLLFQLNILQLFSKRFHSNNKKVKEKEICK